MKDFDERLKKILTTDSVYGVFNKMDSVLKLRKNYEKTEILRGLRTVSELIPEINTRDLVYSVYARRVK